MLRIVACRYQETDKSDAKSGFAVIGEIGDPINVLTSTGSIVPNIWDLKLMHHVFNYVLPEM